jgi:tetratricopeptide (TPR) repeat protein
MEGKAYFKLGSVYCFFAKYDEAMNYVNKSLQITVEEGDKELEEAANRLLGSIYMSLGKHHEAIDCHEKCLKIALEIYR